MKKYVEAFLILAIYMAIFFRMIQTNQWLGLCGWTLVVVVTYIASQYRTWMLEAEAKLATRTTFWEPQLDLGAQGGPGYRCQHCNQRRQYHFCPDKVTLSGSKY